MTVNEWLERFESALKARDADAAAALFAPDGVTEAWIEFETSAGRCTGHLRLTGEGAWTLLTTLEELKGFEERRPVYAAEEPSGTRTSW